MMLLSLPAALTRSLTPADLSPPPAENLSGDMPEKPLGRAPHGRHEAVLRFMSYFTTPH